MTHVYLYTCKLWSVYNLPYITHILDYKYHTVLAYSHITHLHWPTYTLLTILLHTLYTPHTLILDHTHHTNLTKPTPYPTLYIL